MSLTAKKIFPLVAFMFFVLVSSQMIKADPITLFTTGVNSNGGKLAAGAVDPNYRLVTSGGTSDLVVVGTTPATWAGHGASSQWISMNTNGNTEYPAQGAQYVFRTTFTIGAGFDPSSVVINGQLYVDDRVEIRVNGVAVATLPQGAGSGYTPASLSSFTLNSGFMLGTNTIDFVVINTTTVATPVGLQVISLSGNINTTGAAVPEPATFLLLGTGLAGVAAKVARRKKKALPEP